MCDNQKIKNPCIRKCDYNDENLCVMCYRTKKEVFYWGDYSDEEKTEVLEMAKDRKNIKKQQK